ncbi:MAG: hypothetical protein A2857_00900 [Candidatus Levybacteria bacterium RIFCSPHIGHO2_01_FULL_36_15]|nr:MAG: hypothetical protein A2857_00900 [Candidatus Levybacteria bacterium RIFCSPHIGHO2_01_FULL_36_15]
MQNIDKKLLFIANWKSNKTSEEAVSWLQAFKKNQSKINPENKTIIVCPSFLSIPAASLYIKANNLPIVVGAQDISGFESGAYTGEVSARQIREFCEYVIIGHSERRKYNHENDQDVHNKAEMAKTRNLKTIVCVQNEGVLVPKDSDFVAYEPVFAIGSGNADTPESITTVFSEINNNTGKTKLLYGGSVNAKNLESFLQIPYLSGFLIGSASLDPDAFISLLLKC